MSYFIHSSVVNGHRYLTFSGDEAVETVELLVLLFKMYYSFSSISPLFNAELILSAQVFT